FLPDQPYAPRSLRVPRTLLPILVGLSKGGQISLSASLVFGGLFNIAAGFLFRVPICVQPMKAISAVALAVPLTTPPFSPPAPGLVTRLLPLPLIRGIQLGTGLQLINNGIAAILKANWWGFDGYRWTDNMVVAGVVFAVAMAGSNARKSWTALALFAFGLVAAVVRKVGVEGVAGWGAMVGLAFWMPFVPSWEDRKTAFFQASLG
ncbi:hypothetical protein HDU96_000915, partial [Phlyctochytrium bullatum]